MHNPTDIIRLTADQLDGIACIRCSATDSPMIPAGTGERGQLFECSTHTAGCNLNLAKDSLSPAQRNGRACVSCGASGGILKPAGVLLDVKVVECETHIWERDAAANPPTWLTAPCPAWCTERHRAGDHPDDRQHVSVIHATDLLTGDFEDFGMPGKPQFRPISLLADLVQGYREAEPRVCLSDSATKGTCHYLTLAEAEEIAAHLLQLVAAGRGQSDPS
ncbi:DUF6907 domain-containing protein [Streptosporangium canum]|uniref:DUF6907 domain-containing protein n=1 Tax=Streptosporangium canum TaxID=324952 RepID=UPI00368B066B